MPRKRKLSSATKATNTTEEPPQKQQQIEQQEQEETEQPQHEEQQHQQEAQVGGAEAETQKNQEEENGDPGEEYDEVGEDPEENDGNDDYPDENEPENSQSLKEEDDDDDDPVEKLLEPLSKDQLIEILCDAAKGNSDVAEKIRKVADEDPAHRKVFVHGLGWDTTAESLTNEFKKYGEIEDVKNVVDKMSGKCKGYAFILFKTRKGAREALKEPQKRISNRMASCQLAVVGPAAPQQNVGVQQAVPESEYTKKKIYVSNVGAELDPQKLLEFFRKYGEIEDGPLGLDKVSGKPKGFCLFVYKTAESARKALEEPHKNFEGHILHCQKAIDGPKPGKGKFQQPYQSQQNPQNTQFQRKKNQGFAGGSSTVQGHLMAPSGPGMVYNQVPAAAQALNPALGQALTALLSNPAANLGLTNLLGTLGSAAGVNPGMPGAPSNMQGGYGNQGMHGGYGNQPMGPGGTGRGHHGTGHYGGGH